MTILPRPSGTPTHRQPSLPQPGTQASAELALARQPADGGPRRRIAHREHGVDCPDGARPDRPAEWDIATSWLPRGGAYPLGSTGDQVAAEVVHSRWVVRCPTCPSVSRVTQADPRMFCTYCGNDDRVRFHDVVFPPDMIAVERVLSLRPDPMTRNWAPGETVDDLIAENREHGVPGPLPASKPTAS